MTGVCVIRGTLRLRPYADWGLCKSCIRHRRPIKSNDIVGTMCPLLSLVSPACSYNKALAWVDVFLEFIVERLYFLVPGLPEIMGDLAPNFQVGQLERTGGGGNLMQHKCLCLTHGSPHGDATTKTNTCYGSVHSIQEADPRTTHVWYVPLNVFSSSPACNVLCLIFSYIYTVSLT